MAMVGRQYSPAMTLSCSAACSPSRRQPPRTTADEVAFRIDFEAWLGSLHTKERRMAELLAEGHETGLVARSLGVSPRRGTETRLELGASWKVSQAQSLTC